MYFLIRHCCLIVYYLKTVSAVGQVSAAGNTFPAAAAS